MNLEWKWIMMPDKDHPIWKLIQGMIALISLAILVYGPHNGTLVPDVSDVSGAVGIGVAGKLAYQFVKG